METHGMRVDCEYPTVSIAIERITPRIARLWLDKNTHNRHLATTRNKSLETVMNNGEWILNGATIVFDIDGVLMDGQHRLRACIDTNTTIDSVVVRGVERVAQMSMDTGKKRRLADYLSMDGYTNSRLVASVGAALLRCDFYGLASSYMESGTGSHKVFTPSIMHQYNYCVENYESRIMPILHDVAAVSREFALKSGMVGGLFDVLIRADADSYRLFIDMIMARKPQCQPVQVLTKHLYKNKADKNKTLSQSTIVVYFVKAWNAYMQGDEIKKLSFIRGGAHPDKFPQVYGVEQ